MLAGKETLGLDALPTEARNIRRVVHPTDDSGRISFCETETIDRPAARSRVHIDPAADAQKSAQRGEHPLDEAMTGGDQGDVETTIDVFCVLHGVISIDVGQDRSVTVDAAAEKVPEVLIGHGDGPERETLRRGQADVDQPLVESAIVPGDVIAALPPAADMAPNRRSESEAATDRVQQFDVVGDDPNLARLPREVPIRCDESDDPGEVGPPRDRYARGDLPVAPRVWPWRRTEVPNRRSRRETVLAPQPNSLPIRSMVSHWSMSMVRSIVASIARNDRCIPHPWRKAAVRQCPQFPTPGNCYSGSPPVIAVDPR